MSSNDSEVVIEVWLNDYPVVPHFLTETTALAARFTASHPGFRVEVKGIDHVTLPLEVARAAERGAPPAIVQNFYTSTQLARDMVNGRGGPLFTPVGTAIAGRAEILGEPVVVGDIVPASRDYYTVGGELLAMPPLTSTTLLYANMTMLKAAGIREVPRTWAELDAALAVLPHGITWPNHGWMFQQAVAQQGGLLADHDNGRSGRAEKIDLASAEMMAFVQRWQRLHRDGQYHYTGTRSAGTRTFQAWEENFQAFAQQRVAFVVSTSVEAERMVQAGRDGGFDVTANRLPYNGEVPFAGNLVGGDALWLVDGLDPVAQDAALAFTQYLMTPVNAAERHKTSGFIPVTWAAADLLDSQGWFAENPHHRVALDQLDAGDGSPAARGALLGDFVSIQDVMTQAMHDVLVTGDDPGDRFRRATAEAQLLLDDYNAHCLGQRPGSRGPNRFRVG